MRFGQVKRDRYGIFKQVIEFNRLAHRALLKFERPEPRL